MDLRAEDVFSEIGNIGTGSCMASLSHIMGQEVFYTASEFIEPEYEAVSERIGSADENVAGILVNYTGGIEGKILIIFKASMVQSVTERMLGEKKELTELDGRMLDMLKEAANIMASSYLTAVSAYASCRIQVEPAAVTADMAGSILTELTVEMTPGTLCIGSRFGVRDGPRNSFMMILLHERSIPEFLGALEVGTCTGL